MKKTILITLMALFSLSLYPKDLKIDHSIYDHLSDSDKKLYINLLQREGDFSEYIARYPYSTLDIYYEKDFNPLKSSNKIFVIIDKNYYENSDYTERLDRFTLDLSYQNYNSYIYIIEAGNPSELRNFIIANSSGLKGIIFIGDISAAWYEHENDQNWHVHAEWPSDLFFGDLNGNYSDSDGDGIFDVFSGDLAPEIWISRFTPASIIDNPYNDGKIYQKEQFIKYLNNTHKYYRGICAYGNKAANFIGEDWDKLSNTLTRFQSVYGNNVDLYLNNNHNAVSYILALNNSSYGAIYLDAHSDFKTHEYNTKINSILWSISLLAGWINDEDNIKYEFNIEQCLIGLGACSACNFTGLEGNNLSLGIAYLFSKNSKAQTIYGMSKTAYMTSNNIFYDYLAKGYSAGEAFIMWYRDIYNNYLPFFSIQYKESWMSTNGGAILLGNPLIKLNRSLSYYTPNTPPLLSINNSSYTVQEGTELIITLPLEDYDGDSIHYVLNTQIPNASLVGNIFKWTPSYTQGGITYDISIIANDGYEEDNNHLIITVQNVKKTSK